MKVFEANITYQTSIFLNEIFKKKISLEDANQRIYASTGIVSFFKNDEEMQALKESISNNEMLLEEPDRTEYGDFQTNLELANKSTSYLISKGIAPEVIVEPTCGKGNFIISCLRNFKGINTIFGIEIYRPYVWETKFNIINFFLDNPNLDKPDICIIHSDVFDFDFSNIAKQFPDENILIIGNPPWITNSKLGSLNSSNLPAKTNFKNHSGLDAMTGKGNFDIAEFITLLMINTFQNFNGNLLFLVKNSVIKNILFDQQINKYQISKIEKHSINSKKEFNVSVEASLFYCKLNSLPTLICSEFDFYKSDVTKSMFGWLNNKFISNIDTYGATKDIDGLCPFIWRQGLKHDSSAIMELDKIGDIYVNGLNIEIQLEEDLIYGLLKSSDLKKDAISCPRKFTIVTQRKVGQDTRYIKNAYPKTYQYLINHITYFEARKSSIYLNKPLFSIFGIGDYSFKPFKVAISGLYKTFHFSLVLPNNGKPVMLDDTCYLLGFDKIEFAVYTLILLNSNKTKDFLKSITFGDAKRTFTKDILMRIDLLELAMTLDEQELNTELSKLDKQHDINLTSNEWSNFINMMTSVMNNQITIFN